MAEAFLKVVLDNLGSLIKEEIGLILGVDEEMHKLSSTLTTLQAVLEDAEDKQIESKPIRDWLQKLNVLAYEIDDILDECNTHVSKIKHTGKKLSRYGLKKILYRHKIGRRMKRVTEKLESVAAERTKFHLRLCLSNCGSLSEMPSKMRKLTGLKTLSMFVVGAKIGNQLEELHCLNLSGKLNIRHLERVTDHLDAKKANIADKKNLRMLTLSWERNVLSKLEEDDEKVLEALEPHSNLEYLCITGFSGKFLPCWMTNSTLEKIVEIKIRNCAYCTRLPKLGELTHLKKLELGNMGVEYIIEEVGSGNGVKIQFPALEELYLSQLQSLKSLSKEQESRGAFPNLGRLSISRCSSFILQPLPSLQKLHHLKCSSSTLALLSEQDIPKQLHVEIEESLACFPIETLGKYSKLRELEIDGAKEISATREGLEALKGLTSLHLRNCRRMTCIPQGMLQHLTALRNLDIFTCEELVELPEEIKHLHNLRWLQLVGLPKMACFLSWNHSQTSYLLFTYSELENAERLYQFQLYQMPNN